MILVNNSPHDNGVYTFIDHATELVVKSSITREGIARLHREFDGYTWYLSKSGKNDADTLRMSSNSSGRYVRMYVKCFSGETGDSNLSISANKHLLDKAMEHYCAIWPSDKNGLVPLHGDFSVGNLIVDGNDITIIDWEHFAMNAAPWGFDLVNMLYESAYFSMNGDRQLKKEDENVFTAMHKKVSALLNGYSGFHCEVDNLIDFIIANAELWDSLLKKMPVLKFTEDQKNYLRTLENTGIKA